MTPDGIIAVYITDRQAMGSYISVAFSIAFGLLCSACDHSEPQPPTIAAAAGPGAQLQATGDDLLVTAILPTTKDDSEYVSESAVISKRTAEAIQSGAPDLPKNTKSLHFIFLRPDLDRLGNENAHSFISFGFDVADLKAAHVNRLGAYGTLDLAKDVQIVLPWQTAVGQWCLAHDRAPQFCAEAKDSLGASVAWPGDTASE